MSAGSVSSPAAARREQLTRGRSQRFGHVARVVPAAKAPPPAAAPALAPSPASARAQLVVIPPAPVASSPSAPPGASVSETSPRLPETSEVLSARFRLSRPCRGCGVFAFHPFVLTCGHSVCRVCAEFADECHACGAAVTGCAPNLLAAELLNVNKGAPLPDDRFFSFQRDRYYVRIAPESRGEREVVRVSCVHATAVSRRHTTLRTVPIRTVAPTHDGTAAANFSISWVAFEAPEGSAGGAELVTVPSRIWEAPSGGTYGRQFFAPVLPGMKTVTAFNGADRTVVALMEHGMPGNVLVRAVEGKGASAMLVFG